MTTDPPPAAAKSGVKLGSTAVVSRGMSSRPYEGLRLLKTKLRRKSLACKRLSGKILAVRPYPRGMGFVKGYFVAPDAVKEAFTDQQTLA